MRAMFDKDLVLSILVQIDEALERIASRALKERGFRLVSSWVTWRQVLPMKRSSGNSLILKANTSWRASTAPVSWQNSRRQSDGAEILCRPLCCCLRDSINA